MFKNTEEVFPEEDRIIADVRNRTVMIRFNKVTFLMVGKDISKERFDNSNDERSGVRIFAKDMVDLVNFRMKIKPAGGDVICSVKETENKTRFPFGWTDSGKI